MSKVVYEEFLFFLSTKYPALPEDQKNIVEPLMMFYSIIEQSNSATEP